MGKGLPRSHTRGDFAGGASKSGIIKVPADTTITVDGTSGNGWGTVVVGDFPAGNILFLGCVAYLQFAGTGSDADLGDTWQGDYSLGTTPTADNTLATTEIDLVVSTALAAATAEVSPITRGISANGDTGEIHDNTDDSLEINVNLLIDNANIAGDDSVITVIGEIYIAYKVLGDD